MRRLLFLLPALLLALSGPALGQEDRGEQAEPHEVLALGPDVESTVGPPAGPAIDGQVLEDRTNALSQVMRCPVCQGLSIADSPSESSRNMKRQVKAMLAAGYDEEQVLLYFETAYGEFVRMVPKARGFNLLVWIIPGLALLGGFGVFLRTTRRKVAPTAAAQLPPSARQAARDAGDESLEPWLDQVRQELARDA